MRVAVDTAAMEWTPSPSRTVFRKRVHLVGPAESGPGAQWLSEKLAAMPGAPGDAPLKMRIHAFQLAHGLEPDGLAGPMTYMQLNRATGVDEPRLQTGK